MNSGTKAALEGISKETREKIVHDLLKLAPHPVIPITDKSPYELYSEIMNKQTKSWAEEKFPDIPVIPEGENTRRHWQAFDAITAESRQEASSKIYSSLRQVRNPAYSRKRANLTRRKIVEIAERVIEEKGRILIKLYKDPYNPEDTPFTIEKF